MQTFFYARRCNDKIAFQPYYNSINMRIKTLLSTIALLLLSAIATPKASAQFYEIANQIPQLLSPALSGSSAYKGYLEAGYSKTFGHYDADFLEFSTSQGYRYGSRFFMGVGLGVDVIFAHKDNQWGTGWSADSDFNTKHSSSSTAAMLPIFTDFRFNLDTSTHAAFYIDLKIGCSFLLSSKYIEIGNGYLTNRQYFYLRPSIGIRIPTNKNHPKQGLDIGINYKLLTSNYWNSWSRNVTLNGLGASVAFEW